MASRPRNRLTAVPAQPLRMIGAIRVSDEGGRGDDLLSPDIQRTVITDYAARAGCEITMWIEGIDESGSKSRSSWWAKLDQAVELVEAGEYDGIVVKAFDRTARNRLKWAVAIDRIDSAGGRLLSATEQVDSSTPAGRFTRGMFGEMAAFRAETIGQGWKEAHEQRVASGRPHTGKPKWGYAYDRERKLHVPHPEQGPVLADLYRRYIAGESVYQLVRWLNGHGWRTLEDGPWSDRSLRRVLDSGFAAGWFSYREQLHRGVHEPLIDADTWQAYLDAREARRALPPRVERSTYLLSGLVRCAKCGRSMVAHWSDPGLKLNKRNGKRYPNGKPRLMYRCKAGKEIGPQACAGGYVRADLVEQHVLDYLRAWAARVDEQARGKSVRAARQTMLEIEAERAAREAQRVQEALVRLQLQHAEDPMPIAVYRESKARLEQRVQDLVEVAEAAGVASRRAHRDPARSAADVLSRWDRLPVTGRREILRGLIDCVLVRPGRGENRFMRVVDWDEVRA